MNITIYALHLGFGGVEKYICTIANILSKEHSVNIVATYKMSEKPEFYLSSKVQVTYLLDDLKPNKKELQDALREHNILNIVKEGWKSLKILYLKKKRNIESIKENNSDVIISTRIFHNNLISRYAKTNNIRITGEHNHPNNDRKYIKKVIKSCQGFQYFLPISKEICEFYRPYLEDKGVRCLYIRFCIDENEHYKEPSFSGHTIISVGRLSSEKGCIELIKILNDLHMKDKEVILHIVGDGEEKDKMNDLVSINHLENNVIFHGYQSKEYIYNLLSESSVFLMTSFTESLGIVLLEAMSCGIPCIAYDSAQGAKEIIENGVNGFLVPNRDRQLIEKCISDCFKSNSLIHQLSTKARMTADLYSYNNTEKEWLLFMNNIVKEKEN
ncbi:MAG: glycosyltransferase [Erysipelotrichaceae bacterium]